MRFAGKSRKYLRGLLSGAGLLLIVGGAAEMARVPLAYLTAARVEQSTASQQLVKIHVTDPAPARVVSYTVHALYPAAAPFGKEPATGALVGRLTIPQAGVSAPVMQGTSLSILAQAVGHLTTSVLPGEVGTTVLAAHDVTYFHHIDSLAPGDTLTVQTAQGVFTYRVVSHSVVEVGTNVSNTSYPSVVLETCYPLNTLQLVNQRYIVRAVLVSSRLAAPSSTGR